MSDQRLDATVRGRVQGVGFRYFVIRHAMRLDLMGWVANEPDGSVRCVAEGSRTDLEALLEVLERGPAGAIVERVDRTRAGAKAVDLPCTGVFEMRDGKIEVWRDYFDLGTYVKAMT